jgi:hypothetical protein
MNLFPRWCIRLKIRCPAQTGQAEKWQPNSRGSPLRMGRPTRSAGRDDPSSKPLRSLGWQLVEVISPDFLRWLLRVQILLGWLLATLFVAGVTGITRRD